MDKSIDNISDRWINREVVLSVLNKYSVSQEFFLKHFATKIVTHVVNVLQEKKEADSLPIMYIMKVIFKDRNVSMHDISIICSELKEVFKSKFDEDIYNKTTNILDSKIKTAKKYIEEYELKHPYIIDAHLSHDKDRLRDIRFSTSSELSSLELIELLDDNNLNQVETFQSHLDKLISTLDDMKDSDAPQAIISKIPIITSQYKIFANILSNITLFPILVRSFENLIKFLNTLTEDRLEDESNRTLLLIMLKGLSADIYKWLDVVFIKYEAENIYYFDASFANNCLEVELIFNEQKEDKQNIDSDFISTTMIDEDELISFCP
jgi:hypothetical protein